MPVCNEYDIKWLFTRTTRHGVSSVFQRIIINKENILRMMKMVDDPHNGVTFCSGSSRNEPENDLPDMIRLAMHPLLLTSAI